VSDIYQLPDGRWEFRLDLPGPNGQRRQIKRRRATKREAKAERDRLLGESVTQRPTHAKNPYLRDYVARWLTEIDADPKRAPATKLQYRQLSKHLVRELGDVRLRDLSGDMFTALYDQLRRRGLSESSVRLVHVVAHCAMKDAGRLRLVAYNPVDDAIAPSQTPPRPRAWTPDEVARFLTEAETNRWFALWRLAVTTPLRRGELVGLRWSDLDGDELVVANNAVVLDHEIVEGAPKNKRARRVGLDPVTVAALTRWRKQQTEERLLIGKHWPEGDYIWTWQDGTRVHPNVISRTFKRIRDRAGLPTLSLHSLRHAWATAALRAKVDIKVVSNRLGHSSTRITHDVYTAAVPSMDAEAAQVVANLYDGKSS
jgi:integrase